VAVEPVLTAFVVTPVPRSSATGAAARAVEVGAYGPEALHRDVLVVADALGWPRLDLVGHWLPSAAAWMKRPPIQSGRAP
jgi:hypothetical protein